MSYDKAMKHTRNVRKVRKQAGQYMGFAASISPWPNPRNNLYVAALIEVQDWFRHRHFGDAKYNRECIREAVATCRSLKPKQPCAAITTGAIHASPNPA